MGAACCHHDHGLRRSQGPGHDHGHGLGAPRTALVIALALNLGMFLIEIGAGLAAGSAALLADAVDFLGDAANYGVSLFVLNLALVWRARSALLKAASMGAFGFWVLGTVIWHLLQGTLPEPMTMGLVGFLALAVNVGVAGLLYRFRNGDSNMRAVWLCTRNDAIGNLAVMGAAAGVFVLGSGWPDLIVAALMAGLALWSAGQVMRQAFAELARDGRHGLEDTAE